VIDVEVSEDGVLDMPLREAMTFLATILWVMRVSAEPKFRLEQAWDLTLGDALKALEVVQVGKG
jgi:hypothetical protein